MKRTILSLLLAVITVTAFSQSGDITVDVKSSEPVTGLTTIDYEFTGMAGRTYTLTVEVNFDDTGYVPILEGDLTGDYPSVSNTGTAFSGSIEWDGAASFDNLYHDQTKIKITATPVFQCGGDDVTFTYRGSSVTYGTVMVDYGGSIGERCWMDRNLGASRAATSRTDAEAYGDLYQWGRAADGHQIRTSGTTSTLSSSDTPGHGNFILAPNNPWDWRSPQNTNLWQGVNGVNNPCPPGWRVPTEIEWAAELVSWGDDVNTAGAFASPLKLPVAGGRDLYNGSLRDVDDYGYYWSSTVGGSSSRYLDVRSGNAIMSTDPRARGRSVRCLKELE